jgi:hypothetical protein
VGKGTYLARPPGTAGHHAEMPDHTARPLAADDRGNALSAFIRRAELLEEYAHLARLTRLPL